MQLTHTTEAQDRGLVEILERILSDSRTWPQVGHRSRPRPPKVGRSKFCAGEYIIFGILVETQHGVILGFLSMACAGLVVVAHTPTIYP